MGYVFDAFEGSMIIYYIFVQKLEMIWKQLREYIQSKYT